MSAEAESSDIPAQPPGRAARRLAAVGLETGALAMWVFVAVCVVAVGERRSVARELALAWLDARGIEAAVDIERLDVDGFVGRVRVGSERDPIFTAQRLEVAYGLTPPWSGSPFALRTRAVRLVKPRLNATVKEGRLSLGALDSLIEEMTRQPPKPGAPKPSILIEDAMVRLTTPAGVINLSGDGALERGELTRFDGRLARATLKSGDDALILSDGAVRLRRHGSRLAVKADLGAPSLTAAGLNLTGAQAAIEGEIPYPDTKGWSAAGAAALRAAIRADVAQGDGFQARNVVVQAAWTGAVFGYLERAFLSGRLTAQATAEDLRTAGVTARQTRVSLALDEARFTHEGDDDRLTGRLRLDAQGDGVTTTGLSLNAPKAALRNGRIDARIKTGRLTASLAGDAQAKGGLPGAEARRVARAAPLIAQNPAYEAAVAKALTGLDLNAPRLRLDLDPGGLTLAAGAPLTVGGAGGAQATIRPRGGAALYRTRDGAATGALNLALSGGGLPQLNADLSRWRATATGFDAAARLDAAFDLPSAEGIKLAAAVRLRGRGGRTTAVLDGCAQASVENIRLDDTTGGGAKALVCPAGPLFEAGPNGWRAAGGVAQGAFAVNPADVGVDQAAATVRLSGGAAGLTAAQIRIEQARVTDLESAPRFNPLTLGGEVRLAADRWTGALQVSAGAGRPIGQVRLVHDNKSGAGQAQLDASSLAFAKDGLQPIDLSPLAAAIREANGPAAFTGRFDWTKTGLTSQGRVTSPGLSFKSPVGAVIETRADLKFNSLAPLVSEPNQRLQIVRIESIVPLEAVEAVFDLTADVLRIDEASLKAAKGRVRLEPTSVPLTGDAPITGVIVFESVDFGELVAASTLAEKIKLQATMSGRLPFAYDAKGLRFRQGKLTADKPGRIAIDRTALTGVETGGATAQTQGAPPVDVPVNAIQDFAYQAMENLDFDTLEATVDSTDAGRLGVLFKIKGEHQPPKKQEAKVGLVELLRGTAFNRRIDLPSGTPVDLTLDTSLNFDELIAAWRRSWADAEEAAEDRSASVQP